MKVTLMYLLEHLVSTKQVVCVVVDELELTAYADDLPALLSKKVLDARVFCVEPVGGKVLKILAATED